jgi:serine protease Do
MRPSNPTPTITGRFRKAGLAAVLLAGTALGGFAAGHAGYAEPSQGQPVNQGTSAAMPAQLPDFSNLVAQVKPAVVSITSKMRMNPASMEGTMPFPFGQMQPEHPRAIEGRGSGFIIDPNGTIVTNNHVVKGATAVTVQLDDGTELKAKVIGTDPRTDVAVLKVDAGKSLPYIQLGDSATIRPGQWVVAVGNPFGLGGTVTAGIVSAEGRDIGEGPYDQFIQIDAPINQGNSGGPLFTQDGKVVGINTAILSPTGGSIGIGFAIPSNTVKTIVADIEKTGHVTRGYLGVESQAITGPMSKALSLNQKGGALIAGVEPNSPAAKAGVEPGDVIASVDGQKVANPRDLAIDIAKVKPGDQAQLDVVRNGDHKTLTAKIGQMPGQEQTASNANSGSEGEQSSDQPRLGVALAPVSPDVRSEFDLPDSVKGAVVAAVQPGSPAEQAGLQPGDVIVGVGTKPVASPSDAVHAIRSAAHNDKTVALRILRDGKSAFVAVNPTQSEETQG